MHSFCRRVHHEITVNIQNTTDSQYYNFLDTTFAGTRWRTRVEVTKSIAEGHQNKTTHVNVLHIIGTY